MTQSSLEPDFDPELLSIRPGKWTLVVIVQLRSGTMRFNELRRNMGGVPQKSLSQTLRELERDGFISRKAYATIPPRVEYDLTDLGRELLALADDWQRHVRRVQPGQPLHTDCRQRLRRPGLRARDPVGRP